MKRTSKIHTRLRGISLILLFFVFGTGVSYAGDTLIKNIHLDRHSEFTRVVISLDKIAPYIVNPDFKNNKVTLTLINANLSPQIRSENYDDRNLEKIDITRAGKTVRIYLGVTRRNASVKHSANSILNQIYLDIQESSIPADAEKAVVKQTKFEKVARLKPEIRNVPSSSVKKNVEQAIQSRQRNGLEDYNKALKLFQEENYPGAIKAFDQFRQTYPESKFLVDIAFLTAEAEYNIAADESVPQYEKALRAYKYAVRKYPDSKFKDHALYKMALIYEEMNYSLEAKTLYQSGINDRRSPYTPSRQIGLAKMLLNQGKLSESYQAFQAILKKSPGNKEARAGVLKIGQKYYDQKNFTKALALFEMGARQWPESLEDTPQINFQMAEIYFSKKKFQSARKHYFNLINLAPESDNAHLALNRIGDTYILEKNHMAALSVFDQSRKMNIGSGQSQYGQIRMADIGVLNPALPVRDAIFDATPYFQPFKTYEEVMKDPKSQEILAEATLSQGIAYLKEQRYLDAIAEFKKLLAFEIGSRFRMEAARNTRQAFIYLVQDYSDQKGSLPILYAYNDYLGFSLGEIRNIKTLLLIGESYQDIGMTAEALKFYEKVRQLDMNGTYTERIFLDLGEVHLKEGNFEEARLVSRAFTRKYPDSERVPEAIKLLAASFKGQGNYDMALLAYRDLLAKKNANVREAHYLIAEIHFAQKNLEEAVADYKKVWRGFDQTLKQPPEYIQNALYKTGIVQHQREEYSKALTNLQSARNMFPNHSLKDWADYLIADCYTQLREKKQATTALETMVETETQDDLIKKAAESRLKVIDWEKNVKKHL